MDLTNIMARPYRYKTKEELEKVCQDYFDECISGEHPLTITGLALRLNLSRQTLLNYESNDKLMDTVKRAKLVVENFAERQLLSGGNAAGAIFALKNFNWTDKTEHEQYGRDGGAMKYEWTVEVVKTRG